ncbi:hypothetical protein LTR78_006130 [Recurvomyces mirabilis]|uniref:Uncharacterized protein n=1 Tax=Recurvomyces mirabilis TaxID=574656 RepID=A0AAE1C0G2_9PEZI|nr:hypothetical protein LTR78_006130 [Recurvomyces mirabilis]KAK5151973.1 hypothetical protein LTS14_008747 [Recurvomyces mirabilis]
MPFHDVSLRTEMKRYFMLQDIVQPTVRDTQLELVGAVTVPVSIEELSSSLRDPGQIWDPFRTGAGAAPVIGRRRVLHALQAMVLVEDQRSNAAGRVAEQEQLQLDIESRKADMTDLDQGKEENKQASRQLQRWLEQAQVSLEANREDTAGRLNDENLHSLLFGISGPEEQSTKPSGQEFEPLVQKLVDGEQPPLDTPSAEKPHFGVAGPKHEENDPIEEEAERNKAKQEGIPQTEAPQAGARDQDGSMMPASIRPLFEALNNGGDFRSFMIEARDVLVAECLSAEAAIKNIAATTSRCSRITRLVGIHGYQAGHQYGPLKSSI